MIDRHITPQVLAALADTPIVVLTGARQTGKTTLVRALASSAHPARYFSFDDAGVLAAAQADPAGFVAGLDGPIVLDEVQRVPQLFLALKASVDRDRRPGRFLLTGSANVLLVPRLAELLVGRMEVLSLWPLEQFAFYCSEAVASVANIVGTRGGGDRRESRAHRQPQAGHRAGCHRAQARFELGKNLFDGIEVRAVGRQVEHASAHRLDRGPYAGHFMAGQIIQHHRVARAEGRSEELLDIGHEGRAIERAVQDQRGGQPVGPQRGHHGRRLPVPVRDGGDEAGAAGTPPIPAGQLGLDGGLIHEDEASTVEVSGLGAPALAGGQHIRPVLFSGAQDFFLVLVLSDPRPARPWPD